MFDHELDKTIDTGRPAADTYFAGTPEAMMHQRMITQKQVTADKCRTSKKSAVFKMSKHRTSVSSPEREVGVIRLHADQISHRKPVSWLKFFTKKSD